MSYFRDDPPGQKEKSTKEKVLAWKSEIDAVKKGSMKAVVEKKQSISKEITMLFSKLQNKQYADTDEFNKISQRIDTLNEQSKIISETYQKGMLKRFGELAQTYPAIYKMFLEDEVDEETLKHVLNTFDQMEKGRISKDEGTSRGLDFVTDKFNLPKDFFDKSSIGKNQRHGK